MGNHALLSASSSHRWLNCPPSARLCEGYDDKGSNFAAEGSDAHSLCEYKLRKALGMEAKDPTEDLTWYDAEMEESASGYAAFVMELVAEAKKTCSDPVVLIEQRLDYSKYVQSGFGPGDCVLISDGTLHIVAFKYGRGVLVEAEDNPQMKLSRKPHEGYHWQGHPLVLRQRQHLHPHPAGTAGLGRDGAGPDRRARLRR